MAPWLPSSSEALLTCDSSSHRSLAFQMLLLLACCALMAKSTFQRP